jgi:geranyl-CoA carboxylase alpha subunit
VPGYEGDSQDDEDLISQAQKIGAPIMVKAAAGGGGRGMRLVEDLSELKSAITLARSEALNAFGSDELILEKAIKQPRHVEIQVFADSMGNTIHLGERDCSVQRRHQKVIEEAPCPIMTHALREKMGAAAVAAAKSIDYLGAGTVEFLLDEDQQFYFLEMNTRLQVEHPVTELITGLDLVELQLQVAQGQPLGLQQDDIQLNGHAIEVRLYSEDPSQGFLPTSGAIESWVPAQLDGVRVDHGIQSGQEVSPFYDPMVAKIIGFGPNREVARLRLISALKHTVFTGLKSNQKFLINCLAKPAFIDGSATTAFIEQQFDQDQLADSAPENEGAAIAAVLDYKQACDQAMASSVNVSDNLKNWSSDGYLRSHFDYASADRDFKLIVTPTGRHSFSVNAADGRILHIDIIDRSESWALLEVDGERHCVYYQCKSDGITVSSDGVARHYVDRIRLAGVVSETLLSGSISAPMHGLVVDIRVEAGQMVEKGQALLVIEAMKMQHEIVATANGEIIKLFTEVGTQVASDDILLEIELDT